MRSVVYLQPGERRGCIGCHEHRGTAPIPSWRNDYELARGGRKPAAAGTDGPSASSATTRRWGELPYGMAFRRPPSLLTPGPDGTEPWSFMRLVQPVLDRHCVRCHDGGSGPLKSRLKLVAASDDPFTVSYESLRPFVRWYEWGDQSISQTVTHPGHAGADESRLLQILDDPHHKGHVHLRPEDWQRLVLWLDGNASFYGTWSVRERRSQRHGQAVSPPAIQ